MKLRIGVIGIGHLGTYHLQKYAQLSDVQICAICDVDILRAQALAQTYQCIAYYDYEQLLNQVDAVSIVVPTPLHFKISEFFLAHHIHVLVEKPITTTLEQADRLIALAKENQCVLQVGHVERFNPAVLALKPYLNNPRFIEAVRVAPFQARGTEVDVGLDLMIHDIDIIQSLVVSPLEEVHAVGAPVLSKLHDMMNVRLGFANGSAANLTASRVSFKAQRTLRVFQADAYFSLNLHTKEMAAFKYNGIKADGTPDVLCDRFSFPESDPLLDEIKSFVLSVMTQSTPLVTGEESRRALATVLRINTQIQTHPLPLPEEMRI